MHIRQDLARGNVVSQIVKMAFLACSKQAACCYVSEHKIEVWSALQHFTKVYSCFLRMIWLLKGRMFILTTATVKRVRDLGFTCIGNGKAELEVLSIEYILHSLKLKCMCAAKFLILTIHRSYLLWVYKYSRKCPLVCDKIWQLHS